jgi:hypothetical protein
VLPVELLQPRLLVLLLLPLRLLEKLLLLPVVLVPLPVLQHLLPVQLLLPQPK